MIKQVVDEESGCYTYACLVTGASVIGTDARRPYYC
jgi:hypothetical protein